MRYYQKPMLLARKNVVDTLGIDTSKVIEINV